MGLDFESLYKLYPRKRGKTLGLEKCKRTIKTEKDYLDLKLAITNYARMVREEQTEPQYMKHFSSFMSCWRDYLDEEIFQDGNVIDLSEFFDKRGS